MHFDLDFPRAYPALAASARFRTSPEDFRVDEQLGKALSGTGEHLCLHIQKRGQNTVWVAKALAAWAGIRQMDIGYCGLKDRHAVTRQWFSLYVGRREPVLDDLQLPGCEVLAVTRHDRKLRPGEHAANAFTIRLRDVQGDRAALALRWQAIAQDGVPNYFGEQRFGHDGSNLALAESLLALHPREWRQRKHQFAVSALRAWLFNRVLADRVQRDDWRVVVPGEPGDVPSGPLWGRGRPASLGGLQEREQALFAPYAAYCEKLEHVGLSQQRRLLVLSLAEPAVRWEGDDAVLCFQLPPGSFATTVLREWLQCHTPQQIVSPEPL